MDSLRSFLSCLLFRSRAKEGYTELLYDSSSTEPLFYNNEKYTDSPPSSPPPSYQDQYQTPQFMEYTTEETVLGEAIAHLLYTASSNDDALQSAILKQVGPNRKWNRQLIEEILDNIIEYVEGGRTKMGEAMVTSMDLVTDIADESFTFPRNHPESLDGFIAVVSAGILGEMMGAWVLELLGFGIVKSEAAEKDEKNGWSGGVVSMSTSDKISLGDRPRKGTFADWWARGYGEYIPRGGVYSFLKKLDMVATD
ncbi:hypothetical protein QBC38DRAFT_12316 [Podospora fimiseda]|uniref:Uncharacterized protein n=1 Tax=Podospora fimiseda TaxID=252190 RepID=A0AAN7BJT9_9PEZI|nr:hypothetical protein QBC38DRAFT_12316 [Podospora fimiseda]